MEVQIVTSKTTGRVYYHEVEIEINNKKLILNVTTEDDYYSSCIESHKTDLWNTLKHEEKLAIYEAMEEYYG